MATSREIRIKREKRIGKLAELSNQNYAELQVALEEAVAKSMRADQTGREAFRAVLNTLYSLIAIRSPKDKLLMIDQVGEKLLQLSPELVKFAETPDEPPEVEVNETPAEDEAVAS